jgi:hypothetical protein
MAAEVLAQMALKRFISCDNPNCLQLIRHFAKPPDVRVNRSEFAESILV